MGLALIVTLEDLIPRASEERGRFSTVPPVLNFGSGGSWRDSGFCLWREGIRKVILWLWSLCPHEALKFPRQKTVLVYSRCTDSATSCNWSSHPVLFESWEMGHPVLLRAVCRPIVGAGGWSLLGSCPWKGAFPWWGLELLSKTQWSCSLEGWLQG